MSPVWLLRLGPPNVVDDSCRQGCKGEAPSEASAAGQGLPPADLFHRNVATAPALVEATLARACRQLEMVLLTANLARVTGLDVGDGVRPAITRHGHVATLPMLAETLMAPDRDVATRLNMDPGRVVEEVPGAGPGAGPPGR